MMNELYAEFLLSVYGFSSKEQYEALLHERFLNEPDSDILLDLEECSWSQLNTNGRFMRYWTYEGGALNPEVFGRKLLAGVKEVYDSNALPIEEFGRRCDALWDSLPEPIAFDMPFYMFRLRHADDWFSWGEAQVRELYEEAFAFYGFDTEEIDGH